MIASFKSFPITQTETDQCLCATIIRRLLGASNCACLSGFCQKGPDPLLRKLKSSEEVGKGKRRGSSLRDSEEALSGDRG